MSCVEVRDLLAEHALGVLPARPERLVQRHLDTCEGCRREADALRAAAVSLALGAPTVAPPAGLEERIVGRMARRRRPIGRGVARVLVAATLATAMLLVGVLGWGIAMHRQVATLQQRVLSTDQMLRQVGQVFRLPHTDFKVFQARLGPTPGHAGGATVVIVISARSSDLLMAWAALPRSGVRGTAAPYRVELVLADGRTMTAGALAAASGGLLMLPPERVPQVLGQAASVLVVDRAGKPVLAGNVRPYAAKAG